MAYIKYKPLTSVYLFNARLDVKEDINTEIESFLADNEKVLVGAKHNKNIVLFTNKRLLLIDVVQGGFGKDRLSIPYDSISTYCLRIHSSHSSLRITMNNAYPIKLRFIKDYDNITIKEIYKTISNYKFK